MLQFLPCDIFTTGGTGWVSSAIRWATRDPGEERTKCNHVGAFVEVGDLQEAVGVEALWKVRRHPIWPRYANGKSRIGVYRPKNLTPAQRLTIIRYLNNHVGDRYGWWKIGFHLYAKLTGRKKPLRWMAVDQRPICSYLIAKAWAKAGLSFGVKPGTATPDDIMDFCESNPDKYEVVLPFSVYG